MGDKLGHEWDKTQLEYDKAKKLHGEGSKEAQALDAALTVAAQHDSLDHRQDGSLLRAADNFLRCGANGLTFGLADNIAGAGDALFNGESVHENVLKERIMSQDAIKASGSCVTGAVAVPLLAGGLGGLGIARQTATVGGYMATLGTTAGLTSSGAIMGLGGGMGNPRAELEKLQQQKAEASAQKLPHDSLSKEEAAHPKNPDVATGHRNVSDTEVKR